MQKILKQKKEFARSGRTFQSESAAGAKAESEKDGKKPGEAGWCDAGGQGRRGWHRISRKGIYRDP